MLKALKRLWTRLTTTSQTITITSHTRLVMDGKVIYDGPSDEAPPEVKYYLKRSADELKKAGEELRRSMDELKAHFKEP